MLVRREVRRVAELLALLFSMSGSLAAASPRDKPKRVPAESSGEISAALCGRGRGGHAKLASTLDEFDPIALPATWREVEIDKLQRWLDAPICHGASVPEAKLYNSRRMVLDELGRRLERAKVTEQIGTALARFRDLRPRSDEWPSSSECGGCAALRSSAARVADVASRWPPRTSTKLGARLGEAAKRESLIAELCAAKPSPGAREEIERRFRYYSWTADGIRLLEVAAFFEQPESVAGCQGR